MRILWIDWLYPSDRVAVQFLISAVIALSTFLISVLPLIIGAQTDLLTEPVLIIGSVGVGYVYLWYRLIQLGYVRSIRDLGGIVEPPDKSVFDGVLEAHFARMLSTRRILIVTLIVWVPASIIACWSFSQPLALDKFDVVFVMSDQWYNHEGDALPRYFCVSILLFFVLLAMETTARGLFSHIRFVLDVLNLRLISSLGALLQRLRPVLRAGALGSLGWSTGVSFFILFLGVGTWNSTDWFVYALVYSTIVGVGMFGFLVPAVAMRLAIGRIRVGRIENLTKAILKVQASGLPPAEFESALAPLELQFDKYQGQNLFYSGWFNIASLALSVLLPLFAAIYEPEIGPPIRSFFALWST